MNAAEFSTEQIAKWLFTTDTLGTRPTTWYVALHDGAPGLTGANEVTDGNYARQSVDFTAAQPGGAGTAWQVTNDAAITFPATAGSVTVTHVSVFDASTSGNALAIFELPVSRSLAASGVFSIPLNELVITGE